MDRAPGEPAPGREALDAAAVAPEDAAELERQLAGAPDDVTSLLLSASSAPARASAPRACGRCSGPARSPEAVERAARADREHDEDAELLSSAVKASDGFFTTFFVSPYSKYVARWAAAVA